MFYEWRNFKYRNDYYYLTDLPMSNGTFLAFTKKEVYTQIMFDGITKGFYTEVCEECDYQETTKERHRMMSLFFNIAKDLK